MLLLFWTFGSEVVLLGVWELSRETGEATFSGTGWGGRVGEEVW